MLGALLNLKEQLKKTNNMKEAFIIAAIVVFFIWVWVTK